ncbi:MAG: DUF3568 family protein [Rhodospirillales bacterium]|nr:DUF3568 family protein [Rhodospirillales bacterium]
MTKFKLALIAATFLVLQGCAAAALTAAGVASGVGVDHTLSGITYKTFTIPVEDMRRATLKSLARMDIDVVDIKEVRSGWEIKAKAIGRNIDIELEPLTRRTTRMRVVAREGQIFFKDNATSTEIIIQTAETVEAEFVAAYPER